MRELTEKELNALAAYNKEVFDKEAEMIRQKERIEDYRKRIFRKGNEREKNGL